MEYEIPLELKLTAAERQHLPEKVRLYIAALEKKVEQDQYTMQSANDELRRKRFAYWNNKRY